MCHALFMGDRKKRSLSVVFSLLILVCWVATFAIAQQPTGKTRWTQSEANHWYSQQPWLVGANFIPQDAINQIEMWQGSTFNPAEIDRELGWAASLGMNTMRVFLQDQLWSSDPAGMRQRMDTFLIVADRHHIRPVFVLFDSCWDPNPKLGPQRPPIPGVHNSGWVQSPGRAALGDPSQVERLKAYIQGVIGAFGSDSRVLAWDLWNEPDNTNDVAYGKVEPPHKIEIVRGLLPQVFAWARETHPTQPLTSGIWNGDWTNLTTLSAMARIQIEQSDIISFHNYGWPEDFEHRVTQLEQYHRPLLCTEYMARGSGSLFDTILPIAKSHHVGMINWGLVAGKTQTWLPWDSWVRPYTLQEPVIWFHDVFRSDGTLYREQEGKIIRSLTASKIPKAGS
jgi:Cellulase (glycosyl hydrolase family 5)